MKELLSKVELANKCPHCKSNESVISKLWGIDVNGCYDLWYCCRCGTHFKTYIKKRIE